MASFWNGIIIVIISLLYNYLIQQLLSVIFNETNNFDKTNRIAIFLLCGIVSMVCANMLEDTNSILASGILFGSYIMLVDIITSNWGDMDDKLRLLVTSMFFIKVVQYANKLDGKNKS